MKAKPSTNLIPILENMPPEEWRQPKAFYASGLHECGRKQVLGLLGYPARKVTKPRWTRTARVGDRIHEYIVELAETQGILEAHEKPLREIAPDPTLIDSYMVSGRVDGILNRNGNRRLLEVKSMADSKFRMFNPGDQEKFAAAYSQAQLYLWALKLEGGFILAINRDNCEFKEFTVVYDDPFIVSLLARIKRLKEHFENKSLPVPERGKNCYFCGYNGTDQCRKETSEVDWL